MDAEWRKHAQSWSGDRKLMAFIFADSFDLYDTSSDIGGRWDSVDADFGINTSTTPYGTGKSLTHANTNATLMSKSWAANDETIYISVRHRCNGGTSNLRYMAITLLDEESAQVTLRWQEDNALVVLSGGVGGSSITSQAGAVPANTWDSFQIKIVIGSSGSVEVRKNGSTSPVINVSGVNTRAGSANNYANRFLFTFSVAGAQGVHFVDDLFINSGTGAAPNDWPGDVRGVVQTTASTVSSTFNSTLSSGTMFGQPTATVSNSLSANTIKGVQVTVPYTGTITQMTFYGSAATTASINGAIYNGDGTTGLANTLLATATADASSPVGPITFDFSPGITVTTGQSIWLCVLVSATFPLAHVNSGNGFSVSRTYALGFPSTLGSPTASSFSRPACFALLTVIPDGSVTSARDTNYIFGAAADTEAVFTLSSLSASPRQIVGLQPFVIARKAEAGPASLSITTTSQGTGTIAMVPASDVDFNYGMFGNFIPRDPATNDGWLASDVNLLSIGVKIT